ncbi:hypothetical protein SFUMM280S_01355 [Streptomyces fumanus]
MVRPAPVEPVKAILSMPGCEMRYSLVLRSAGRMLTTPSGTPAALKISPSNKVTSAFSGEVFRTTVQPASSAGTSLVSADWCGAFQGMTAATTPTGSRCTRVRAVLPSVRGSSSSHGRAAAARR